MKRFCLAHYQAIFKSQNFFKMESYLTNTDKLLIWKEIESSVPILFDVSKESKYQIKLIQLFLENENSENKMAITILFFYQMMSTYMILEKKRREGIVDQVSYKIYYDHLIEIERVASFHFSRFISLQMADNHISAMLILLTKCSNREIENVATALKEFWDQRGGLITEKIPI